MHKNVRLPIAYHVIGHPVLSRAENVHGVWLLLLDFFFVPFMQFEHSLFGLASSKAWHLLLQFNLHLFETLNVFLSRSEDVHVNWMQHGISLLFVCLF